MKPMSEGTIVGHQREQELMDKAHKALAKAKDLEKKKFKNGYKFIKTDDKTWKLQSQ